MTSPLPPTPSPAKPPPDAPALFPPPRVAPHAGHAWGGVWRLTVRRFFQPTRWLVTGGLLLALAVIFGASLPARGSERLVADYLNSLAFLHLSLVVPVIAFISAGGLLRDDLGPASVDFVFTRPLRRSVLLAFRYLAHVACMQLDLLLAFAVLIGLGVYHGVPHLAAAVPLLLLGQALLVIAFSAFGFLCAALTSRYLIVGFVYTFVVEVGIGGIPTQLSRLSMTAHVKAMIEPVFARAGVVLGGGDETVAPFVGATSPVLVLLAFSAVTLALAAAVVHGREPVGGRGSTP